MEHGGRGFRAGRTRFYAARMVKFRGIGTGEYHMRPTTSKLLLADLYCVCSLKRANIVETVHLNIEFPEELSP